MNSLLKILFQIIYISTQWYKEIIRIHTPILKCDEQPFGPFAVCHLKYFFFDCKFFSFINPLVLLAWVGEDLFRECLTVMAIPVGRQSVSQSVAFNYDSKPSSISHINAIEIEHTAATHSERKLNEAWNYDYHKLFHSMNPIVFRNSDVMNTQCWLYMKRLMNRSCFSTFNWKNELNIDSIYPQHKWCCLNANSYVRMYSNTEWMSNESTQCMP